MKKLIIVIISMAILHNLEAQNTMKNHIDLRLGYGGIDGFSPMKFLSISYGRQIKYGLIPNLRYMLGHGSNNYQISALESYGVGINKAVNTAKESSINLGLGYNLIKLSERTNPDFGSTFNEIYHGLNLELYYLYNFNSRSGAYLGGSFTSSIFMVNAFGGYKVYF